MQWQKTTLKVWSSNGFRIQENPDDSPIRGFRLDLPDPDAMPLYFPGLDAAKTHASLLNELQLLREHNEQLRAELSEQRDAAHFERQQLEADKEWPPPMENEDATAAQAFDAIMNEDDGRGIPIQQPTVKIHGEAV